MSPASAPFVTGLELPNHPDGLQLARTYLENVVRLASIPEAQAGRFVAAVVEAAANVLDHAFEPGEKGTYRIRTELTATHLTAAVWDHGLPFDPFLPTADARPNVYSSGDGFTVISDAVDSFEWVHLGREGKELRMTVRLPERDITQQLSEAELTHEAEDAPLAPEQEYRVVRMEPQHAVGVSRCIYRVYGNTYLYDDCYYPERLVRLNETGELVSVVALDEAGTVVGHYALERPRMTRVAERGIAVVSPAHRGRDLMGRMRVWIEQEAARLGLVGVWSQAVTEHVFSQRVNEEFDSRVCGLILAGGPSTTVFRKITSTPLSQRVSYVLYFTYVQDPGTSVVHAPRHHREMIARIYQELRVPVEFRDAGPIPDVEGEVEVAYSQAMNSATIRVVRIGEDTAVELRRARADLCGITGAEAVFLDIPLAQPGAPELCLAAEADGFFFEGIGPSYAGDGDALLLQYLPKPLDTERLKIHNPFARELLEYVASERARVSAA